VLAVLVGAVALLTARAASAQCVSLTTLGSAYTQSFDTLSATAGSTTNNLIIPGWYLTETGGGTRDNEQYAVDTGASNTGDTYSYGAAGSTERALGGFQSGTLIPVIGACFTNDTGGAITSLDIAYTGEQWRIGNIAAARDDRIDFQLSLNATGLTTGTWTDHNALDFTNVIKTNVAWAPLNGNSASNQSARSSSIPSLSIANGATFWIRWTDLNASGQDDALAVDDFSLTPQGAMASLPTLSIDDVSSSEGDAGTTTFTFTVSLSSAAPAGGVTFDIATADGTAMAGGDYTALSLTGQTIPAGSSSTTFAVSVAGDGTHEGNETFLVNVTNLVNATAADAQGQGTITNDDPPPTLTIADVTAAEGTAITTVFTFTVSLSSPAPAGGVSFDVATVDGTATSGNGDFTARSLTGQSIPAGASSYTFDVAVTGDDVYEGGETFGVEVSNVTGATVGDGAAVGLVTNDDLPTLSIDDVTAAEGTGTTTVFRFAVSLSGAAPAGGVTFDVATADGTAVAAAGDYTARSLTGQTIPAGSTTYTFDVAVSGDDVFEGDETFLVNVSNVMNAVVADHQGTSTIVNDDALPTLSVGDVSLAEGDAGTTTYAFTVALSAPAPAGGVTFDVATASGSATSGDDFAMRALTAQTIPAGSTTFSFDVAVTGDLVHEEDETFLVSVTNVANATVGDGQGQGTITNDDAVPTISIDDVSTSEGNLGTTTVTFTVALSSPAPAGGVTFDIATADGTAQAAENDYVARALAGQSIAAGGTSYSFAVTVNGDVAYEPHETLFVDVSNVVNATIGDGRGLGTLTNDDPAPCLEGVNCAAGNYCDASDACVPQKANGVACDPASQCKNPGSCVVCASGNCVDGVCCDTACGGTCNACSAARKGGGVDGVCGAIGRGLDPDAECAQDPAQSCGFDGTCNGAGACGRYDGTVSCGPAVCVGAESRQQRCDGAGACVTAAIGTACGPLVCSASTGQCLSSCSGPADCAPTHYCNPATAQCAHKSLNGGACQRAEQCTSGFCVDGICCSTACQGACQACSAAKKGQGVDGACGAIAAGRDPDDDCAPEGAQSCGRTGQCDGAGACAFWPVGTDCGAAPGQNACEGNRAVGRVCAAPNTCALRMDGTECAPQRCASGACAPCVTSADCTDPTTHFCDASGACKPKKAQGQTCGAGGECASGSCVDGVCCESACDGACEWCGDPEAPGTCKAAPAGQPKANRTCAAADAAAASSGPCARACDGQTRAACVFPPAGTACAAARCGAGGLVAESTCDGAGACVPGQTRDCGRYVCDSTTSSCMSSCRQSVDCRDGSVCDLRTSTCVPPPTDAGAPGDARPIDGDAAAGTPDAAAAGGGSDGTMAAHDATYPDAPPGARPDGQATGGALPGLSPSDGGALPGLPLPDGGASSDEPAGCACAAPGRRTDHGGGAWVVLLAMGLVVVRRRLR
jgi:hypothetical protein